MRGAETEDAYDPRQIGRESLLYQGHYLVRWRCDTTFGLSVDNRDYFQRPRVDNHNFVRDHEIFKAAPCRFDFYDGRRKSYEPHSTRHSSAD